MTGREGFDPDTAGYLGGPWADEDSTEVLQWAADALGDTRRPLCRANDAGVRLHALASIALQIHLTVPETICWARDQHYPWTDIAGLLGVSVSTAQRWHRATRSGGQEQPLA